jgi:epsin
MLLWLTYLFLVKDDFDDFQSAPAPPSITATTTNTYAASKKTNDIFDLLGDDSFTAPPAPQQQGSGLMLSQAMSYDTLAANRTIPSNTSSPIQQTTQIKNTGKASETESNISIGGIWSQASSFVSLDSLGKKSEPAKPLTGPSMNALRSSSSSANWGNWGVANSSNVQQQQQQQRQQQQQQQTKQSSAFDDLLF